MNLGATILNKTSSLNLHNGIPNVLSVEKIIRPSGYSLPGYSVLSATIQLGNIKSTGFGEGSYEIALSKAVSEATERLVLKLQASKAGGPESSNGWACHKSAKLAIESAIFELIERDVALSNWESNGPFYEIPQELYPLPIKVWGESKFIKLEFGNLRIFLSKNKNGACVSSLLFNESGNFVVGHASGKDLSAAMISSLCEAMRAAHAALRFENYKEVSELHDAKLMVPASPGSHSLAYAYNHSIPNSVVLKLASAPKILKMWQDHNTIFENLNIQDFYIQLYEVGELFVARVRSNSYRPIHWGTKLTPEDAINKNPHFVG